MNEAQANQIRKAQEQIRLKEKRVELIQGLPFLYGWKWYPWAKDFFLSTNKINLLCAANQISKSSTQIRKCIDWATNQEKWPQLWLDTPKQFWYLYPTASQATIEFEKKWSQFLPRGKFKDDPKYGWREIRKGGEIHELRFHSGVSVYFKTYSQNVHHLQTGTVDAIFCDEELPIELYEELMFRLSASDGYFHMVFTATIGQDYWRQCLDPEEFEEEKLPDAWKRTVSLYDAKIYEDGSSSHWSDEKIQIVKNRCRNAKEVLKRVYGKFIRDDQGRKYEQFDVKRHVRPKQVIPPDWLYYVGVDPGSGGQKNHPGAICFIAVSPDYTKGRVVGGWRGDGLETTASDILLQFQKMRDQKQLTVEGQYYDWASKDFSILSDRAGESFQPADKSHERGEQIINVLFKNNMMFIEEDPELHKLASELIGLRKETPKNKAKDDFSDAFRYAITSIPWDFSVITSDISLEDQPLAKEEKPLLSPVELQILERRSHVVSSEPDGPENEFWSVQAEIAEANEDYGEDF